MFIISEDLNLART